MVIKKKKVKKKKKERNNLKKRKIKNMIIALISIQKIATRLSKIINPPLYTSIKWICTL
jgi:hypothetical protein